MLSHLRTVQAIVTHLEQFPPIRARAACARARHYGNLTYCGVRDILRQGLDREPLPCTPLADTPGERPRFARSVQELLRLIPKEVPDELH